ncbi:hypothetical protein C7S16_0261 [Burkholderia thailandensis]|uniref:Uncharacterized protein n=1 Tax=Burkholderia thailandensis TaxID=57975 RepID=A0AAW9D032_BURTH|nr:hypothetical protein [Burkholderia thailandensis]MDW9256214.1 hypothetical protein [Burkholderia thailandensis]
MSSAPYPRVVSGGDCAMRIHRAKRAIRSTSRAAKPLCPVESPMSGVHLLSRSGGRESATPPAHARVRRARDGEARPAPTKRRYAPRIVCISETDC